MHCFQRIKMVKKKKKKDKGTNSCLQENLSQNEVMNSMHFRQGYVESYRRAINIDTAKETSTEKMYKQRIIRKNKNRFACS